MTGTAKDFSTAAVYENKEGDFFVLLPGTSLGPVSDRTIANKIRLSIIEAYVAGRRAAQEEIREAIGVS